MVAAEVSLYALNLKMKKSVNKSNTLYINGDISIAIINEVFEKGMKHITDRIM